MTDLQGRQISRLGAHFDPIVAAFAPLWWVWPDPSLLLVVQAAGGRARRACRSSSSAAATSARTGPGPAFALAYLLYPPTQWLVLDDFHPVALATPLLLWGFWFLDGGRLVPFALVARRRVPDEGADRARRRRDGSLVRACEPGADSPASRSPGSGPPSRWSRSPSSSRTSHPVARSPFAGRYAAVGGSPGGIVETALTDPGTIVSRRHGGPRWRLPRRPARPRSRSCPLLAPAALLTAAPELAARPALLDQDPDVDPLPLHGGRDPRP